MAETYRGIIERHFEKMASPKELSLVRPSRFVELVLDKYATDRRADIITDPDVEVPEMEVEKIRERLGLAALRVLAPDNEGTISERTYRDVIGEEREVKESFNQLL